MPLLTLTDVINGLTSLTTRVTTIEQASKPVRQDQLVTALQQLETSYASAWTSSSGEGSNVGPRTRAELVARAKRELVADLLAALQST